MSKLKKYRTDFKYSKGRFYSEKESSYRNPFMRDRDRLVHSAAFRRLEHKTQVFVQHEGDNFRSRLTHTIEVAQIARTIATRLGLDSDLAETIALAHDLGHTPFGHAGEEALNKSMKSKGGFDHNAQTLRIVTKLEKKYANFEIDLLELKDKYNLNYQCHNYFPPPQQDFVLNLASLNDDTFNKNNSDVHVFFKYRHRNY